MSSGITVMCGSCGVAAPIEDFDTGAGRLDYHCPNCHIVFQPECKRTGEEAVGKRYNGEEWEDYTYPVFIKSVAIKPQLEMSL